MVEGSTLIMTLICNADLARNETWWFDDIPLQLLPEAYHIPSR